MSVSKRSYSFRANNGDVIEVSAPSEAEARTLAMTKLHGPAPQFIGQPPNLIGKGGWRGSGLSLMGSRDESDVQ